MRLYWTGYSAVAVSASQDLINLTATANMAIKVHAIAFGQKTLTSPEGKELVCQRFPATVTAGSGGSAATPRPVINGDAAATFTSRVNDTTPMTTSGTAVNLHTDVWNFLNGYFFMWAPEQRPNIAPSQGMNFKLATAPSGSMTSSGSALIEELY